MSVIRSIGYSGSYQTLTVSSSFVGPVTAYLWGGGGGGGALDGAYGRGGNGGGGGFCQVSFNVSPGDVIGIAVGGAGGRGYTSSGGGGGSAGASFTGELWNSLALLSTAGTTRQANGAWCGFLNTYGVWGPSPYDSRYQKTVTIYFPNSGNYTFTGSCDNYAYFYVDGVNILTSPDYHYSTTATTYISAGFHDVTLDGYNSGGPGGIGLTIVNNSISSYSGAVGGAAGGAGSSGGGGGSGGATVVTLNGNVLGVAGGGGGGGGAGQFSYISQCDAPGLNAHSGPSSGQAGQNFGGDGGGGGAGGGGYQGGDGGATRGGETTGYGGAFGVSWTSSGSTGDPSGRSPGGLNSPYRTSAAGIGGQAAIPGIQDATSGTNGYAVIELSLAGTFVKNGGTWQPAQNIYLKDNGQWKKVKDVFLKSNGQWRSVVGNQGAVPSFTSQPFQFGVSYRGF